MGPLLPERPRAGVLYIDQTSCTARLVGVRDTFVEDHFNSINWNTVADAPGWLSELSGRDTALEPDWADLDKSVIPALHRLSSDRALQETDGRRPNLRHCTCREVTASGRAMSTECLGASNCLPQVSLPIGLLAMPFATHTIARRTWQLYWVIVKGSGRGVANTFYWRNSESVPIARTSWSMSDLMPLLAVQHVRAARRSRNADTKQRPCLGCSDVDDVSQHYRRGL
jgi:hypothetical protein